MWDCDLPKWLESINYACLYVVTTVEQKKCGPGKEKWQQDLDKLSSEQRVALEERIERWQKRIAS